MLDVRHSSDELDELDRLKENGIARGAISTPEIDGGIENNFLVPKNPYWKITS